MKINLSRNRHQDKEVHGAEKKSGVSKTSRSKIKKTTGGRGEEGLTHQAALSFVGFKIVMAMSFDSTPGDSMPFFS
jgi:hypothetical protein